MRTRYKVLIPVMAAAVGLTGLQVFRSPVAAAAEFPAGRVVALPGLTPDETTFVRGMNGAGQIIGETNTPVGIRPVVWTNRVPRELPLPPNTLSAEPRAINNSGVIVGTYFDDSRAGWRSVRWDPDGSLTVLAADHPGWALATDINDRGEIVGWTGNDTGDARPVRFVGGTVEPLFPGFGYANAVTNRSRGNRAVGQGSRAFEVSATGGQPRNLPRLSARSTEFAIDVSADGNAVAGNAWTGLGGEHAVLWRRSNTGAQWRIRDLTPDTGRALTQTRGISPDGKAVVGDFDINGDILGPGEQAAFFWTASGGLRMLPEPLPTGCRYAAVAVANSGLVAGNGCANDDRSTGIVWEP